VARRRRSGIERVIQVTAWQFITLMVAAVATAALVVPAALQPQSAGDSLPQIGIAPIMRPLRSEDIAGRWGWVAYFRDRDRARAEELATRQCRRQFFRRGVAAYEIRSAGAAVMMHNHDDPNPQEMTIKANSAGQTFIGPGPDPGGIDDREVVSYDGHVMILRWLDPKVASIYGVMLYVRCAPGQAPPP
jgi:hypothetical protein